MLNCKKKKNKKKKKKKKCCTLNFSIKSRIMENFFSPITRHVKGRKAHRQFYFLDSKNFIKRRTLLIQPQECIGKYSKHFPPKMTIIG